MDSDSDYRHHYGRHMAESKCASFSLSISLWTNAESNNSTLAANGVFASNSYYASETIKRFNT